MKTSVTKKETIKEKRLSQPVKQKEKSLIIKKLSTKKIKVPTKTKSKIILEKIPIKRVEKISVKESQPKTLKSKKQKKTFKERIIAKKDVSPSPKALILSEYKNYIDKFKIKSTTQVELQLLIKIRKKFFEEGLEISLKKISKERNLKEKDLFIELHSVLNNANQPLRDISVFQQEIINFIKDHDIKMD